MGNYKKYSDEFKQEALAMVAAGERSVSKIERDLDIAQGIDKRCISTSNIIMLIT